MKVSFILWDSKSFPLVLKLGSLAEFEKGEFLCPYFHSPITVNYANELLFWKKLRNICQPKQVTGLTKIHCLRGQSNWNLVWVFHRALHIPNILYMLKGRSKGEKKGGRERGKKNLLDWTTVWKHQFLNKVSHQGLAQACRVPGVRLMYSVEIQPRTVHLTAD